LNETNNSPPYAPNLNENNNSPPYAPNLNENSSINFDKYYSGGKAKLNSLKDIEIISPEIIDLENEPIIIENSEPSLVDIDETLNYQLNNNNPLVNLTNYEDMQPLMDPPINNCYQGIPSNINVNPIIKIINGNDNSAIPTSSLDELNNIQILKNTNDYNNVDFKHNIIKETIPQKLIEIKNDNDNNNTIDFAKPFLIKKL
jgi:hypothetical protein